MTALVRNSIDLAHPWLRDGMKDPRNRPESVIDSVMIHFCCPSIASRRIRAAWSKLHNGDPAPFPELGDRPVDFSRLFTDPAYGFGWPYEPYTFAISYWGDVDQLAPITIETPHARKAWSRRAISVCFVGENYRATPKQFASGVRLVRALTAAYCKGELVTYHGMPYHSLLGHTEAPDSTNDPGKKCPEPVVDMDDFRRAVYADRASEGRSAMIGMGVVL